MRVRRSRRPGRGRDTRSLCAERQDAAEGRELAVAAAGGDPEDLSTGPAPTHPQKGDKD